MPLPSTNQLKYLIDLLKPLYYDKFVFTIIFGVLLIIEVNIKQRLDNNLGKIDFLLKY